MRSFRKNKKEISDKKRALLTKKVKDAAKKYLPPFLIGNMALTK